VGNAGSEFVEDPKNHECGGEWSASIQSEEKHLIGGYWYENAKKQP